MLKEKEKLVARRKEELDYLVRNYKSNFPYDPKCGVTEDQWWKQIRRRRDELKQQEKQRTLDRKLENNSPTMQVLDRLDKIRFEGCKCTAEFMRSNQICPVCRLMRKVYDYTLELFKETAGGRLSGTF